MKIRIKKELPFAKVGMVFEVSDNSLFLFKLVIEGLNSAYSFQCNEEYIDELIKEGWIEEVKEETLECKINNLFVGATLRVETYNNLQTCDIIKLIQGKIKEISELSTEHFKERFDKAVGTKWMKSVDELREELFK